MMSKSHIKQSLDGDGLMLHLDLRSLPHVMNHENSKQNVRETAKLVTIATHTSHRKSSALALFFPLDSSAGAALSVILE
jgi:hypothetical protein